MSHPWYLALNIALIAIPSTVHSAPTGAQLAYLQCAQAKADEGRNVQICLDELGRHAWYPLNEDVCNLTANILESAFNNDWDLSYKLLFFNERCAHIGYPNFSTDRVRVRSSQ